MNKMYFSIQKQITYAIVLLLLAAGNIPVFAQAPNFEWAKQIEGAGADNPTAIAVDNSGNTYTTGSFIGTTDFDPGPGTENLTANGLGSDIFILKLDVYGNYVWAKQIGGAGVQDLGYAIAVDDSGNVYTTGSFRGTADFDPGPGTENLTANGTNPDIFILKLNANGNYIWAKRIGGTGLDEAKAIAVDNSGNVYTTGSFTGTVDFDPGPGTENLTASGLFISKLDANGNYIWAKRIGGTGGMANAIAVDNSGNVYTTGSFIGTVDFDPGPGTENLTANGANSDIFISKLDVNGNYVWAKGIGGSSVQDQGRAITVDDSGYVYTTGIFRGTADFDPGPGTENLTANGTNPDIFISKLDANGNYIWAKQIGGTGLDEANAIAVDDSGYVYTTGGFNGIADFDPGPGTENLTTSSSASDFFISKLDANGNYVWAGNMGGINSSKGYALALGTSGSVYTTGTFIEKIDFDPGPGIFYLSTSDYTPDGFIHKMSQSLCTPTYSSITATGCDIDSFILNGQTYKTSGIYTQIFTNAAGCDSVLTLSLTFKYNSNTDSSLTQIACDNYTLNGQTYTQTGTYTQTFTNAAGCDSILTLHLTINQTTSVVLTEIVCGGSFTLNGQTYTQTGLYTQTFISTVTGCDSIIHLDLTTNYTGTPLLLTETVCGDSYTLNGQTYTQTGIYTQTYQTVPHGCDSVVTLDLTLHPIPDPSVTQNGMALTAAAAAATYQWASCSGNNGYAIIPGATQQTYTVTADGGYALFITANGCSDTSGCIQVTDSSTSIGISGAMGDPVRIYPNPAYTTVHITAPFTVHASISSPDGKILLQQDAAKTVDISRLPAGMYLLRVTGSDGRLLRAEKLIKTAQ